MLFKLHPRTSRQLLLAALPVLAALPARAMDMRFDVATDNNNGNDTDWFGPQQLPALNFTSVNGHNIEQGGKSNQSAIQAAGNTLGVYYDTFDNLYSDGDSPSQAESKVQSWIKSNFGSTDTGAWVVLNEVNGSVWNTSGTGTGSGDDYRTWLVNTMQAFNTAGYKNVILFSSQSLASKTYASTWQAISQYAYISPEMFIDGPVVQSDNFSVSTLQAQYQSWANAWTSTTSGAGVAESKLIACEHFSVNQYAPGNYWGADGLSGTAWEEAIEARDIAIHNIPFGGFIGYAWDKDAQATGNATIDLANQLAYEKAYASTLTTQTEVPAWTGNDGTTSWADYLNWTGGLPSTTSAPFPLLASTNPDLPKQTSANFLNAATALTVVTLDGNQSVTNLSFANSHSYYIEPGTGGSLTLTGSGASLSATQGSHYIVAGLVLGSNVAANITSTITVSGSVTNQGYTLTKSGSGTLLIEGAQTNSPNSAIAVSAGTLIMDSDAGSSSSAPLAFSQSAGKSIFNSAQHLASLSISGGTASFRTTGQYLLTHSLSLTGTGKLDLQQNDLIDNYTGASPLSTIQAEIKSGYNSASWNGNGILTTSALTQTHAALGYAEASDILGITGSQTAAFDGQTIDATTVLVKYTWQGDANLDGTVNALDFNALATNYGKSAGTDGWIQGDFNYDGTVDSTDFSELAANYGQGPTLDAALPDGVVVPEPLMAAPLLLVHLIVRRRRPSA